ncbi:DUF1289 domain-containing protein [Pseudomonas jinjuensis]|uniref:DUF1289 domain-containing protein n=1 Tax=Pseudomonas jinjuensis TaxID=198616 RepID=UPI0009FE2BB9|nr:DUF1289 domain-containing protein [Pseudomonas jinjuensis]
MSSSPVSDAGAQAPVPSPCRRRCCLDDADICLGCGRSLAEILEWNTADGARRRQILGAAQGRRNPLSPEG